MPDESLNGNAPKTQCLWHTADDRCSNCKARRIRCDVLGMKDYGDCRGQADYADCTYYIEKPALMRK